MAATRSRILAVLTVLSLLLALLVALAGPARAVAPGPELAWGDNGAGQLGDGTTTDHPTPVAVCAVGATAPCASSLTDATAIATGDVHALAVRSSGAVVAWGFNNLGQLGDGTTATRTTPVPVCAVGASAPCASSLTGATAVAAGNSHSLALRSDGTVVAWGSNSSGQLGDGTTTDRSTPVQVCAVGATAPCASFLSGVTAIAASGVHSLALRSDGSVVAWGSNGAGRLGDGTTTDRSTPVQVCAVGATAPCASFLSGVTAIAAGGVHSMALRSGGTLVAWGNNNSGRLGDGTIADRSTPVQVCAVGATAPCGSFLSGVTAIAAGDSHSMAVAGGVAHTWGTNTLGQLGDGTTTSRSTPVRVCALGASAPCASFLSGVTAIDGGDFHSLAVAGTATLAWGGNLDQQLGDGTSTSRSAPVRVCAVGTSAPCASFLSGATAVAAGRFQSYAITTPPAADLAVDLRAAAALLSSTITYTLTISNHGPAATSSGTITIRLPGATSSATSSTCTYNPANKTASCPVGVLASGGTATRTVRATIGVLTVGLPLPASATRTASTPPDPNPANDSDSADCAVVTGLIILC